MELSCVGKHMESMQWQGEQDIEIWHRCVGLKAALAAGRGQIGVEQEGSVDC